METLHYPAVIMIQLSILTIFLNIKQHILLYSLSMHQEAILSPQLSNNQLSIFKQQEPKQSSELDLQKLNPNSDNAPSLQNQIHHELGQMSNSGYWVNSKVDSKWNNPIPNQKKGRFTQQQQKILSTAVGQFLAINEITYDEFEIILNEKNIVNKILKKHNFYNLLSNLLPNRSANSCYRFLKRNFNKLNRKGKWSKQQEQKLVSLVEEYGRQWIIIGKQMGRTSDNVYDKYRSMGSSNADKRKKCSWRLKQLIYLVSLVDQRSRQSFLNKDILKQLQNQREHNIADHHQRSKAVYNTKKFTFHNYRIILNYLKPNIKEIALDRINWTKIADKILTRSFIDCKNKFLQVLEIVFKNDIKRSGSIINFIKDQGVKQQNQIRWQQWSNQQFSSIQAKNRFLLLKKSISDKSIRQFNDYLKELKLKLEKN